MTMGVKMKTNLIAIVLVGFLCFIAIGATDQKKDPVEELGKRIESLEKERDMWKNNLAEQKEIIKEQINNKTEQLDNRFKKMENDLKDDNSYIKVLLWIFGTVTGIGIITAIIALIFSFFKIRKRLEVIAEEKIREKFDQIFSEKKNQIITMIDKQNEELQLKKEKSILVIRKNPKEDPFIEKFFKDMEFSNVQYETLNNVKDLNKYDLILFNNEKLNIDHADLLAIVAKTKPEVFCFYFGPDRFDGKEFKDRVNFANSRVQLYGNLINSLRYQSLLK
jgi:hypothetical protein